MTNKFIIKAFLTFSVLVCINSFVINRNNSGLSLESTESSLNESLTNSSSLRQKRAFSLTGGLAMGFGAYDYYNYYGDLVSDYSYDYYDWICSETSCQLCDILTSECCDPDVDVNCFLPDTCFNNPCLSGGTCISSKTVDDRPDFTCVCLPGLTGKYCQLVNDYFIGAERLAMAMLQPTAVLGGLGGLGLSIPTGPGAPPIPPILAVLSEIQQRLAPPPPQPQPHPHPPPGGNGNDTDTDTNEENNQKNDAKMVADQKNYPANVYSQYNGADNQMSTYGQKAGNPSYVHTKSNMNYNSNGQAAFSHGSNNPNMPYGQNQPRNVANNQAYSNYQGNYKSNPSLKALGAKRIPCPEGKIYNFEKEECTDFSLRKKTQI